MDSKKWNAIYEIVRDFSSPENAGQPLDFLYNTIEKKWPTDRGLSIIRMDGDLPICIRWPDYAAPLIPAFNGYLNQKAPRVYRRAEHMLGPVNWKEYSDTEYDSEFNRPLNIGYSIGFDIFDADRNRTLLFVIHETRKSRAFTDENKILIKKLQPLLQQLYTIRFNEWKNQNYAFFTRELETGCLPLTNREREILQHLLSRASMKDIAGVLNISKRTVETHSLHIYQKLCVSSRKNLKSILSQNPAYKITQ